MSEVSNGAWSNQPASNELAEHAVEMPKDSLSELNFPVSRPPWHQDLARVPHDAGGGRRAADVKYMQPVPPGFAHASGVDSGSNF